jgi:hypothetical protein
MHLRVPFQMLIFLVRTKSPNKREEEELKCICMFPPFDCLL